MRIVAKQLGLDNVGYVDISSLWSSKSGPRLELIHGLAVDAVVAPQDDLLQWADGKVASMRAFAYFLALRSVPQVDPYAYLESLEVAEKQHCVIVPSVRKTRLVELAGRINGSMTHSLGSTATARLLYRYIPPTGIELSSMRRAVEDAVDNANN